MKKNSARFVVLCVALNLAAPLYSMESNGEWRECLGRRNYRMCKAVGLIAAISLAAFLTALAIKKTCCKHEK